VVSTAERPARATAGRALALARRHPHEVPVAVDPAVSAKMAGLRYVSDAAPGIRRRRAGKNSSYVAPDGAPVRDRETLRRIRSLAIPPAWEDVWICPAQNGHIQATGRDAKGRKQYRYHPRWREVRDETKYGRMIAFGRALPQIRTRVERDLALPDLPREKVLAAVVRLLETTLVRVGNEEYARNNGSYGLTTMRDEHAEINGHTVRFVFRGKSGKEHRIGVRDRRLARIVKRCQDLPGQDLFQYVDESGQQQSVGSSDVNDYLREITGEDFTAKDFRTWAGTVLAALALQEFEEFDSETQAKRNIVRAIESVAERLGNTPAVCRKCYVHPAIIDSYLDRTMLATLRERTETEMRDSLAQLSPEEGAVLALLRERLSEEAAPASKPG
jgi:DNA topoisomerase-1